MKYVSIIQERLELTKELLNKFNILSTYNFKNLLENRIEELNTILENENKKD